jgi:hypothetical protein
MSSPKYIYIKKKKKTNFSEPIKNALTML